MEYSMRKNMQLTTIANNMPDYVETRDNFFELYPLILRMGGVNYVALTPFCGVPYTPSELLALYLSGVAYGRASELSEKGAPAWGVFEAWQLVQHDLAAIMPPAKRLPAPVTMLVPLEA
jgi:hypothetical protein